MINPILRSRLRAAVRRERVQTLISELAACWLTAAAIGFAFVLIRRQMGWASPLTLPLLAALTGGVASFLVVHWAYRPMDYRALAQRIEQRHPELNGLLLTAVQQETPEGAAPSYLQHRLIEQAVDHSREKDWREIVPRWRVGAAQAVHLGAVVLLIVALAAVKKTASREGSPWVFPGGMVVTPGDASIERGESLVVLARFGGSLPAEVNLVVRTSGAAPRQIALVKSLADPVFGVSIPEVDHDLTYHLEYGSHHTRDYKISVFEHPRLEQANALLTYPTYTKLAPKRIENTRRVSAVEGTQLQLDLRLNKPVVSAELVARDDKKTVVPLKVAEGKAVASLPDFALKASQTYDLRLVDSDGRKNALATPIIVEVLPDRPPELHVNSPRGDQRPSPVEEINFAGTLLGEFGVSAYGLAYTLAGGQTKTIELGTTVPALEKRSFNYILHLEDLGVQPDQLLSWYVWADDTGPDGKPRRTTGDLYFDEIRRFDEIFRENQGMQPPDGPQNDPSGQGSENQKLAELQKQIISATWKLQRNPSDAKYVDDTKVVHDSQDQALGQATKDQGDAEDPRAQELWSAVTQEMKTASSHLRDAGKSADSLAPALAAEQSAYQSLLRLQPHSTQVSRGRGGRGGGGANQRQLAQLDLTQEKNRYETQRQAAPAQTAERSEQLQVMNRLQELARRQQEVNDRLKEMQTALQEAKTEAEREDLRRQLKRLQDEQQQVVADTDELRQRIDQQQNQANLADQRRQLDQTRSDVQQAADAAAQGKVSEALASGTRAQRQFQTMRDELHKQNSSQFADDLKQMRTAARELAQKEEEVAQKMAAPGTGAPKRLSDGPGDDGPTQALAQQKQRMTDLVNRAKQVSQQAENSEPLLAEKLYDTVRQLAQTDGGTAKEFQQTLLSSGLLTRSLNDRLTDEKAVEGTKSLDLTAALLDKGYLPQATEAEERAREEIGQFKEGMERAAESVVGDDEAALRLAESQLDTVTKQLQQEAPAAGGAGSASDPNGLKRLAGGQTSSANDQASAQSAADRRNLAGSGGPSAATDSGQPGSSADKAAGADGHTPSEADLTAAAQRLGLNGLPPTAGGLGGGQPGTNGSGAAGGQPGAGPGRPTDAEVAAAAQRLGLNGAPGAGASGDPVKGDAAAGGQASARDSLAAGGRNGRLNGDRSAANNNITQGGAGQRGGPPGGANGADGQPGLAAGRQPGGAAGGAAGAGGQPGSAAGAGGGTQKQSSSDLAAALIAAGRNGGSSGEPSAPSDAGQPAGGQRGPARRLSGGGQPGDATGGAGGDALSSAMNNLAGGARTGGGGAAGSRAGGGPVRGPVGPITGEGYGQWSDRLREVEEIVDSPDLRNTVAAARERGRLLRQDFVRNGKPPDWAVLQLQIVKPLLDVRNEIADELARRGSKDSLVPIDRDPVPNRYAESVRKYYEELGKDK